MKKVLTLAVALFFVASLGSKAQLMPGSFGIGTSFAADSKTANFHYCINPNMDLKIGLGFLRKSTEYSNQDVQDKPTTDIYFEGMLRYFLSKGKDFNPYIGGDLLYYMLPESTSGAYKASPSLLGLAAIFGVQGNLTKQLAVYAHLGLTFSQGKVAYTPVSTSGAAYDYTYTEISLMTSAIGAVFYFEMK